MYLAVYTLICSPVSICVCLLHYFGKGVVERVVQNQKLSRTAVHHHCIKTTLEALLDMLKIKFNGHMVVFLTKIVSPTQSS